MGFIFYRNSRRNISIENCDEILNDIEGRVNTVAVTVNPNSNDLKLYSKMKFTHLQLHGKMSLDTIKEIRETFNFKIIKAFNISSESDLVKIDSYFPYVDHILLDSKHKTNMPGGTGETFDWEIIRNYSPNKSFFLSGGLNTNNILNAFNTVNTKYFDVSSGVENSEGIKDEKLIFEFISKVNEIIR